MHAIPLALTGLLLSAQLAAARQTTTYTLAQTEPLARSALAAQLEVPEAEVTVVERRERTWPDADLGCAPRKGVFESAPTAGYQFILEHAGRRYEYRSDTAGHVRRCPPPKRPAGKPKPPAAVPSPHE